MHHHTNTHHQHLYKYAKQHKEHPDPNTKRYSVTDIGSHDNTRHTHHTPDAQMYPQASGMLTNSLDTQLTGNPPWGNHPVMQAGATHMHPGPSLIHPPIHT